MNHHTMFLIALILLLTTLFLTGCASTPSTGPDGLPLLPNGWQAYGAPDYQFHSILKTSLPHTSQNYIDLQISCQNDKWTWGLRSATPDIINTGRQDFWTSTDGKPQIPFNGFTTPFGVHDIESPPNDPIVAQLVAGTDTFYVGNPFIEWTWDLTGLTKAADIWIDCDRTTLLKNSS